MQTIDGDFIATARLRHADGAATPRGWRALGPDGATVHAEAIAPGEADVVQLERRRGRWSMATARFGEPFTVVELASVPPGESVRLALVGDERRYRDVRVTIPAPEGFRPYQDYIGGTLELLEVATGERTVLLESPAAIQAPNWTRDGAALVYNEGGLLWRFDLASRRSTPIDTGFATSNNNDHVLSWRGDTLAISHHVAAEGNDSIVFTVPLAGGEPTRVTAHGPSYLHGWSPDDRSLVYTGGRGGVFDIYRIATTGGEETRLTSGDWLDDGPEYTPDGAWIWFNSSRSGRMQLWRMRPDGGAPERMTHDGFNDWFPHISPDGRSVAFLSYLPDVAPDDHPWYRPVYLRLMPAGGGPARVIAYVYGGQGTINVPSWSPDSRRLAFVSNSVFADPITLPVPGS